MSNYLPVTLRPLFSEKSRADMELPENQAASVTASLST
jgi:hypothetical protein